MERVFPVYILITILVIIGLNHLLFLLHRQRRGLPLGPLPLPVIGNLHQLTCYPHRGLCDLSRTYGPIMLVHLGNVPMIVVSTPRAAELFLKTHDAIFSSRPRFDLLNFIPQWKHTMLLSPNNSYWRHMRRLCIQKLLTDTKVREFGKSRKEAIVKMVRTLRAIKKDQGLNGINMSRVLADVMGESVCRMVMRCDDGDMVGFEVVEAIQEMAKLFGTFNIGDYIPFFRLFDLQGLRRRAKEVNKVLEKMLEAIITNHEKNAPSRCDDTFVDMLMALMDIPVTGLANEKTSDYIIDHGRIKAIIIDMIAGGIETTSTIIDWTLSEILRNPKVLKRLQDEIGCVVGKNRMVEESDMQKLEYLEMAMKETLRLHPPAPLLVPHESVEDVIMDGYFVPKGARIVINVWAIGQDPGIWGTNAEEFCPERFEALEVDFKGRNFEFLPFGSGRRSCPGMNMGVALVKLTIAQLVHCFDWEMPEGMSWNDIDMSEEFGLSMPRANDLYLIPRYRLLD
ncbi:hypothetical protein MLD38_005154 [Melastoma candidum]|uniref:Uncharacterized protein n=1 Tax=Melastoma candidum TaxID=119954 RepID=A0ACB9S7V2_9MYRT|nr:hypothetical protein MLD38_005154 [Melastoma candidum]